ncbi:MAG: CDP-alcohol phosphatidyltransferase family protein [Pseudomonadota bacterium]
MASIYDLKPKFQALLRPLCRWIASAGGTANQVTILALLLSLAFGSEILATDGSRLLLLALPLVLFVRMALNAIDGMLAREFSQQSKLGAILNEVSDLASDAALYLPFALFFDGPGAALLIGAVVMGLIAEATGMVAVQIGASRRYDGPFGKSDRAFFFGVLALLLGLGAAPGVWTSVILGFAVLAGGLTVFNRARAALLEARDA